MFELFEEELLSISLFKLSLLDGLVSASVIDFLFFDISSVVPELWTSDFISLNFSSNSL